jgi:hypothetical protein
MKLCRNCGCVGKPKRWTKGSFLIEVVLWIIILPVGFLYSIWRLTTRCDVCLKCGSTNLLPADSPVARKLLRELQNLENQQYGSGRVTRFQPRCPMGGLVNCAYESIS